MPVSPFSSPSSPFSPSPAYAGSPDCCCTNTPKNTNEAAAAADTLKSPLLAKDDSEKKILDVLADMDKNQRRGKNHDKQLVSTCPIQKQFPNTYQDKNHRQ